MPEVHITAAAEELLEHLAAEPDALMVLARAGAQAMVTRVETDGATLQVRPHC